MLYWTAFRTIGILTAVMGLVLGLSQSVAFAQSGDEDPLQISALLKPYQVEPGQIVELELKLSLPEQYKAYEEQFHIVVESPSDFKTSQFTLKPVHAFWDEFSKRNRRGMVKKATMRVPIEVPAEIPHQGSLRFRLTYQACTKSYCLFPITRAVEVHFQSANKPAAVAMTEQPPSTQFFSKSLDEVLGEGLLWTFIFVFFAGVLTSLTPCIYPIVPITLAVLSRNSHLRTKWQSVILAHSYVLGIAITYALLGLVAASTGALFGNLMTSPWFLAAICLVFLAMALSMLGLYDLQPPTGVQSYLDRFTHFHGPLGAFVTGVVSGLLASPCVGPVLVGILTYVAKTQNLWLGFWLLFVFALGMGQLFLVLGLSTHMTKKLPKSGPWLDGIKKFSGVLLLGVFYYYLSLLIPEKWFETAVGIGFILVGSVTYAFINPKTTAQRILKGLSHAMIFFGVLFAADSVLDFRGQRPDIKVGPVSQPPKAKGIEYVNLTEGALEQSKQNKRPVILDFHADWCAACHELDAKTYTDPKVLDLANKFDVYKFDMTNETPESERLRAQFKIVGLPWVVFIDENGNWLQSLTLAGFEEPGPFLERMKKALK